LLIVYDTITKQIESLSGIRLIDGILPPTTLKPHLVDGLPEGKGEYYETDEQSIIAVWESHDHKAGIELVFDANGNPDGIKAYSPVSVTVDKSQITADGIDTATITATVELDEIIELYNGSTLVDSQQSVNGTVSFQITMSAPDTITLTIKSTTKYGQKDVSIEGV
jgi:hypothetical protein